ncbi:MAG: hypothetical protein WCY54_08885, partial [Syntrophales bacterium]
MKMARAKGKGLRAKGGRLSHQKISHYLSFVKCKNDSYHNSRQRLKAKGMKAKGKGQRAKGKGQRRKGQRRISS